MTYTHNSYPKPGKKKKQKKPEQFPNLSCFEHWTRVREGYGKLKLRALRIGSIKNKGFYYCIFLPYYLVSHVFLYTLRVVFLEIRIFTFNIFKFNINKYFCQFPRNSRMVEHFNSIYHPPAILLLSYHGKIIYSIRDIGSFSYWFVFFPYWAV